VRILQVIPSFYPAHVYGGPIQSVYRLSCQLARRGHEVRVLTTDANGPHATLDVVTDREVEVAGALRVRYCQRRMAQSVAPRLLALLPRYVGWADIVHLTAVYSFPTMPTLLVSRLRDKPVVWSPRGAFQRWEGSTRFLAKVAWEWACRRLRPRRLVLHATSEQEAAEFAGKAGGVGTAVIANGVDLPETGLRVTESETLRLLYLGRLDAKKGIENLLAAGKILDQEQRLRWSLTIAGAGHPRYVERIRARIDEQALSERVQMVGHVAGEGKRRLFENTDIAVLPSYTENFGAVVGEALAHGVPVIAGRGTPWSRVEEIGCGLWVDNDAESLSRAIVRMADMPLRTMGRRGQGWMAREFSWDRRAHEMVAVYEELARTGERANRRTASGAPP
jgi:glycosyltransferase involved in cell wall biosynthesis